MQLLVHKLSGWGRGAGGCAVMSDKLSADGQPEDLLCISCSVASLMSDSLQPYEL